MAKQNAERAARRGSTATAHERKLVEAMLVRLKRGKDVRTKKVRRVRLAIVGREYENPLKLAVAAERVADELG